jgi:hypothetical protein
MGDVDTFLREVQRGRCAAALGVSVLCTGSELRRAVAAFHPDRGGDTELSALANACAEALRSRRPLEGLHRKAAERLLQKRAEERRRQLVADLDEEFRQRRVWLREQKALRVRTPERLQAAQHVAAACAEACFTRATLWREYCGNFQVALGLQRGEVDLLLAAGEVWWRRRPSGHRVAARDSRGLQLTPEARAILRELAAARVG